MEFAIDYTIKGSDIMQTEFVEAQNKEVAEEVFRSFWTEKLDFELTILGVEEY